MLLKEKFNEIIVYPFCEDRISIKNLKQENNTECEIIADEFAIEFAEWCWKSGVYTQFKKTQLINKQLLDAFKKEKGL